MNFPSDLRYTKDHEWVRVEGGTATMGITEFAASELGEVVFVELPAIGKSFKQADSVCVVESTKAASDVYAPIGGTIKEVNKALSDKPELVNQSAYENGWMAKLGDFKEGDLKNLMSAEEYRKHVGDR